MKGVKIEWGCSQTKHLWLLEGQVLLEMLTSFEYKESITELGDAIYNSDKTIVNNKFKSKIINRILNKLEK